MPQGFLPRPGNAIKLFFIHQLLSDDVWKFQVFAKAVELVAEIERVRKDVEIRIRKYSDCRQVHELKLMHVFEGLSVEITSQSTPLDEDMKWATNLYTVCSNAIFAVLLVGKPAHLIWNSELDEIYGRAFLPNGCIIGSPDAFFESLIDLVGNDNSESILQQVLGVPGAMDRALAHLNQLVAAC